MPLVYDIRNQQNVASLEKPIFADTNVLFNIFYDQMALVRNPACEAKRAYRQAIASMLGAEKPLHLFSLVLAELENVFVKNDLAIFNRASSEKMDLKPFRAFPAEMSARQKRYDMIFRQIKANPLFPCLDVPFSCNAVFQFVESLDKQAMDTNDFVIASLCAQQNGVLMTDDKDYASSVTPCDLMTCNPQLLSAAQANGFSLVTC